MPPISRQWASSLQWSYRLCITMSRKSTRRNAFGGYWYLITPNRERFPNKNYKLCKRWSIKFQLRSPNPRFYLRHVNGTPQNQPSTGYLPYYIPYLPLNCKPLWKKPLPLLKVVAVDFTLPLPKPTILPNYLPTVTNPCPSTETKRV